MYTHTHTHTHAALGPTYKRRDAHHAVKEGCPRKRNNTEIITNTNTCLKKRDMNNVSGLSMLVLMDFDGF